MEARFYLLKLRVCQEAIRPNRCRCPIGRPVDNPGNLSPTHAISEIQIASKTRSQPHSTMGYVLDGVGGRQDNGLLALGR